MESLVFDAAFLDEVKHTLDRVTKRNSPLLDRAYQWYSVTHLPASHTQTNPPAQSALNRHWVVFVNHCHIVRVGRSTQTHDEKRSTLQIKNSTPAISSFPCKLEPWRALIRSSAQP